MFSAPRLAIDLGTANTVIMVEGEGIVLQEPTVAAVSTKERKILAVGAEAKEMLGKEPKGLEARRPLQSGGIANYLVAEALLKKFFAEVLGRKKYLRPEVIVSVPAGITSVEERAVIQAMHSAGAGRIFLLPEPIAAALGAELPINTPSGNMIVNLGGGTAEIAVLSLNGIVSVTSRRGAGDALNEAIMQFMRKTHNLLIGEQMAEKIKFDVASAVNMDKPLATEVRGGHVHTGMPTTIEITSNDLVEPMRDTLNGIGLAVRQVLADTPPELAADIIDRGMIMSGGTSMLRNVDAYMTKSIGVPAYVVEDPLLCVVKGLEIVLNHLEDYRRVVKG